MGLVKSTADEHHACQNPTKTEIDTDPFGYASTEQQNEPLRESQKSALDTKLGTVLHMHVQLGSSIGGEGGGGGGVATSDACHLAQDASWQAMWLLRHPATTRIIHEPLFLWPTACKPVLILHSCRAKVLNGQA